MMNLSAVIQFHAQREPEKIAIVYESHRINYADLSNRIGQVAGYLVASDIRPDDVVAVVMKNSTAFLEIAFAISHVGAIFLPINYRLSASEIAYIVDNASAKLIFVDEEFQGQTRSLSKVILVNEAAQSDSRLLAGRGRSEPLAAYRSPENLFRLMYTSGTTGRPKGVMHTYSNFYWKSIDHVIALRLTAEARLLVVGPLYHVGALDLPGLAVLWVGGTLCVLRDFDPSAALASIEKERLTCAWMAPVMLGRMLGFEDRSKYDVTSLQWCIGGAEKTPEARIHAFTDLFPKGRYIDGYGITESCSGDTLMEAGMELEKIGSTGRPTPHVEIEIRDETGGVLGTNVEGEICLRGPKITPGYWKDPHNTRASFFGDWFRTGDIGLLDNDGFLYVTDRKKDMIISGGENVASQEIERVIYLLDQVSEVAVIGLPDEKWGERPVAVVVLREGTLDYPTLAAHCRKHLGGFKIPKELHLRSDLPRNPSGKVLKRLLREEFR